MTVADLSELADLIGDLADESVMARAWSVMPRAREGLASLLTDRGIDVVGRAGDATTLEQVVRDVPCDVVIIDVRMPPDHTDDGARVAGRIRLRVPTLGILLLSQHIEVTHSVELVAGGGFGYLLKDRALNVDDFLDAPLAHHQNGRDPHRKHPDEAGPRRFRGEPPPSPRGARLPPQPARIRRSRCSSAATHTGPMTRSSTKRALSVPQGWLLDHGIRSQPTAPQTDIGPTCGWTAEFVSDCHIGRKRWPPSTPSHTSPSGKAAPHEGLAAGHPHDRTTQHNGEPAPRWPIVKRHAHRFARYIRGVVGDARGVGNRAAITVVVPLLAVYAMGHLDWAGYASFAAFTALYGRTRLHINRFDMQLSVGVCLLTCMLIGIGVSLFPARDLWMVPVGMLIAYLGQVMSDAQDWHPKGPLFLLFAYGTMATTPHTVSDLLTVLVVGGLTVVFALIIGSLWVLRQEQPVRHLWQERMRVGFDLKLSWKPLENAVAAGIAGVAAMASGVGHPFWAVVAAVVPLAGQGIRTRTRRAVHRVLGTLGGLLLAYGLLNMRLPSLGQIILIGVLQLLAELFVGRHYAVALAFVTPLALVMGQLAHPSPITTALWQRGIQTAIGSAVGISIVVLSHALAAHRPTPPIT